MYRKGLHFKYQNIKRLRQIANVLIKHGMGYLVGRLNLVPFFAVNKYFNIWRRRFQKDGEIQNIAVSVRLILEELGPTFVKFGQMLSARPDLLPEEFSREMKKLQDSVPPFPFEQVKQEIEREFKAPLEKLYRSFDPVPYAAASVAQVHVAQLHNGKNVVVKVQRPGIKELIEKDLELLFYFTDLLEKRVPESRLYQPTGVAEELAHSIRRELDFMLEANNAKCIRDNFQGDPTVYVPEVYWELTSPLIITMERVDGIPVDEIEQLKAAGLDLKTIALNGCEAFLKQIFEHGFFHADPHPGNILVGENNQIIFLDFGLVGHLDDSHMTHIANVLFAIIDRDYDRLVHEYLMLGFASAETDAEEFKRDIVGFFEHYYGRTLKDIPIGLFFVQAMQLMGKHRIKSPPDLMLLAKTIIFVESIGRQLDLDFNLLRIARPYAGSLLKKRLHPKRLASIVSKNLYEVGEMLKVLPRHTQLLLRKLLQGELEIGFVDKGQEALIKERRRSSQEIAVALIVAALIIGAALLFQQHTSYVMVAGVHLGTIGLLVAAFLGLLLLVSMFSDG